MHIYSTGGYSGELYGYTRLCDEGPLVFHEVGSIMFLHRPMCPKVWSGKILL